MAESDAVGERLDREDQVLLPDLARAELTGVFHRRVRREALEARRVSHRRAPVPDGRAQRILDVDPADGTIVQQVARSYAAVPHDVFLRTADCLHLVTALQQGLSEIHTHDRHQCDGARGFGLEAVTVA